MKNKTPKIFIGPIEIAGYYKNLYKGFKELEIDSAFFTYHNHLNNYGGETKNPILLSFAKRFYSLGINDYFPRIIRYFFLIIFLILSLPWMIYIVFRYDTFIFGFGQSLVPGNYDLPLLKLLNKTVISVLAHGSDTRPAYIDGSYTHEEDKNKSIRKQISTSKTLSKRLAFHENYSSFIIGHPFTTSFFARSKFINFYSIGLPNLDYENIYDFENFTDNKISGNKISIIHCPSHSNLKGTSEISSAIDYLKEKGHEIDFKIYQGLPQKEILKKISKCDFVVDQLYGDSPMASLVAEAAWLGKPSVVAGYGLEKLKEFVPKEMWPPSQICHPDEISNAIEELIIDRTKLTNLARQTQLFVKDKYNPKKVAMRFLNLIEGEISNDSWIDPMDVFYIEGGGQSRNLLKDNMLQLLKEYGVNSLCLSHRSDLEEAFLKFSGFKEHK